jgi:hypothetical protein
MFYLILQLLLEIIFFSFYKIICNISIVMDSKFYIKWMFLNYKMRSFFFNLNIYMVHYSSWVFIFLILLVFYIVKLPILFLLIILFSSISYYFLVIYLSIFLYNTIYKLFNYTFLLVGGFIYYPIRTLGWVFRKIFMIIFFILSHPNLYYLHYYQLL